MRFWKPISGHYMFQREEMMIITSGFRVHNERHRESILEILFEHFKIGGLCIKSSACLAAYLFSKEDALIIDIGGHNTYISPVHDGFQIDDEIIHRGFGGEDLTLFFDDFLARKRKSLMEFSFFKRNNLLGTGIENFARLEIVRDIKHTTFKVGSV